LRNYRGLLAEDYNIKNESCKWKCHVRFIGNRVKVILESVTQEARKETYAYEYIILGCDACLSTFNYASDGHLQ
jgi:hypothetical protein